MEKFEIFANGDYLCGESPIWDVRTNEFFWCDLLPCKVFRFDEKGQPVEYFGGKSIGGFAMNAKGGYVCSTLQGMYLWDEQRGFRLIADRLGDDILAGNDCIADPEGRVLFGSVFYDAFAES